MSLPKRLYFTGVPAFNLEWLKKKSPLDLLIPVHHLVSDEPVHYINPLYSFKDTRGFEADLDYLLRHFREVSLTEVIEQQKKRVPFKQKSFMITFDDGLRQVYEVAAPILLRKGVPAAMFINPSFIDNKDLFYDLKKGLILDKLVALPADKRILHTAGALFEKSFRSTAHLQAAVRSVSYANRNIADTLGQLLELDFESFRKEQRPFMTLTQLKDLAKKGFAIGSHSMDHPLYANISLDEQIRQTLGSTGWVSEHVKVPYRAFAFPHVDTGVGHAFFHQLVDEDPSKIDLILGNRTGMLEKHPRVLHRFFGEDPSIPAATMVKAVLAYSIFRKSIGRPFVSRPPF